MTNEMPPRMTTEDLAIASKLAIDSSVILLIRTQCQNPLREFPADPSAQHGMEREDSSFVPLKGLLVEESNNRSYEVVLALKDSLLAHGYIIFLAENYFGIGDKNDQLGVLQTRDQFAILQHVQTNGYNYDISPDSIISIVKGFHARYDLQLIGASFDWCEFEIHGEVADWTKMAEEVYAVCPDVVDQGTGSIEAMVDELKRTKRLYFWWD